MKNFDDALSRAQEGLKRELYNDTEDEKMTFLGTRIYRRLQHACLKASEKLAAAGAPHYPIENALGLGMSAVALRTETTDRSGLVGIYISATAHPIVGTITNVTDSRQALVQPAMAHVTVETNNPKHMTWHWTPNDLPPCGALEVRFMADDKTAIITVQGEEPVAVDDVTDWVARLTARRLYELNGGFR